MNEVLAILEAFGRPYAYDHFAEGESPDPPFACYLLYGSDNFDADDKVYAKFDVIHIELYTDEKSPDIEKTLEALLDAAEIVWEKSEVWIESEKLYEVMYEFTVYSDNN